MTDRGARTPVRGGRDASSRTYAGATARRRAPMTPAAKASAADPPPTPKRRVRAEALERRGRPQTVADRRRCRDHRTPRGRRASGATSRSGSARGFWTACTRPSPPSRRSGRMPRRTCKGFAAGHPLRGEEWLGGPYAALVSLQAYAKTLRTLAEGRESARRRARRRGADRRPAGARVPGERRWTRSCSRASPAKCG